MDVQIKLHLLKYMDSYWTLLPPEIKALILKYRESQELIEWRESFSTRVLCRQIEAHGRLRQNWFIGPVQCRSFRTRVPFLQRPGNLTGPESYFEIKASRKLGCVLTSHKVHFVSLANNFTIQFSNFLKLPSGMENKKA